MDRKNHFKKLLTKLNEMIKLEREDKKMKLLVSSSDLIELLSNYQVHLLEEIDLSVDEAVESLDITILAPIKDINDEFEETDKELFDTTNMIIH